MTSAYADFIAQKSQLANDHGFEPIYLPDFLFDFQRALVDWALRRGRAALFCDCGMGKTPMQLVWAENVVRKTGGRVLIATPLAVAAQTIAEADKFGIEAHRSSDGAAKPSITVTNYERLEKFNPSDFAGMVCDESSCLKSFDGARRKFTTEFMRKMPYRLLCTATAAPNDFIELGTSSEALGQLGYMDMLGRFFKNDQNTSKPVRRWTAQKHGWASLSAGGGRGAWRLKGHAHEAFWRWVCSWARALRRPSDLGFSDDRFVLPALEEREHLVTALTHADGMLPLGLPPVGLREERDEMRRTIRERCERVAEIATDQAGPFVAWCHLNAEGDALTEMIPGARQVRGSQSPEEKEEAFRAFSSGDLRVLVIKPKIGAWGLNWQHCSRMAFFPSHSFEQYYQAVRRSWRFGQEHPVVVDIVTTESGRGIMRNLQRKARQSDEMFSRLVAHMNDALDVRRSVDFSTETRAPAWL